MAVVLGQIERLLSARCPVLRISPSFASMASKTCCLLNPGQRVAMSAMVQGPTETRRLKEMQRIVLVGLASAAVISAVPAHADPPNYPSCQETGGRQPCDWGKSPDIQMGPPAPPGWVPGPNTTDPWAPASPGMCPPGTIPVGGSQGIQNYRCVPNPAVAPPPPPPRQFPPCNSVDPRFCPGLWN
jgi:hypothetical protein